MKITFAACLGLLAISCQVVARDVTENQAQDIFRADPSTLFRENSPDAIDGDTHRC